MRCGWSSPNHWSEDAGKQLTKSLSFEPPLPLWRLHCYGSTCNVSAHVADDAPTPSYLAKPRSTYTVRIKSGGIRDAWGQSLPAAAQAKLQTGPLSPQLRQGTWGKVLEAATAGHKMALYLRNLQQVTVRHRALTAADLSRAGAFDRGDAIDLALDHTTVLDPNRQLDRDERRVVDLMTLTGGKRGLYAVEIKSPQWLGEDGKPRTIRQVLQLTDLHLLARLGGTESLFWVTSLQTGKPQAGVALELQAGWRPGVVVRSDGCCGHRPWAGRSCRPRGRRGAASGARVVGPHGHRYGGVVAGPRPTRIGRPSRGAVVRRHRHRPQFPVLRQGHLPGG
jgi:hypothetical protein